MRVLAGVIVLVLLLPCAAYAQRSNEISLFLSDVSSSSSDKPNWYGGFGLTYSYFPTASLSADLSVSAEDRRTYSYVVGSSGEIIPVTPSTVTIYPYSLTARYHWLNDSRWKPYLGGGLRYVAAPKADTRFHYQDKFGAELVGGVTWRVVPSFGITLEGMQVIGDVEPYDPSFRVAVGATWRF